VKTSELRWWQAALAALVVTGWLFAGGPSGRAAAQKETPQADAPASKAKAVVDLEVDAAVEPAAEVEPLPAETAQPASSDEQPACEMGAAGAPASEDVEDFFTDAEEMQQWQERYEREQRALIDRLRADPEWQPTHEETTVIATAEGFARGSLNNFCLDRQGNLMACLGGSRYEHMVTEDGEGFEMKEIKQPGVIRIFNPEGERIGEWKLDFGPQAICQHTDGTIYVAGNGRVAKLSATGKVLAEADSPVVGALEADEKEDSNDEKEDKEEDKQSKSIVQALFEALGGSNASTAEPEIDREYLRQRCREVTGIAVTNRDVFIACPMTEGYGYAVWRVNHELADGKQIVEGLRGCCGQMDIQAYEGNLWVAENGRHRAVCYDREGEEITNFGKRSRKNPEGFGGCCEPKNLRFGPEGVLYAAESGPPNVVKRYTTEGECLGVAALADFRGGCVRTTVEVSGNGSRIYVLDTTCDSIRVFTDARHLPTHVPAGTIDVPKETPSAQLHTFCVDPQGRLLAACGGERRIYSRTPEGTKVETTFEPAGVHVLDPDGKLLETWKLDITPQAINVAPNGTVFVGGQGKLARLGPSGEVLLEAAAPNMTDLPPLPEIPEETEEDKEAAEARKKKTAELAEKQKALMPAIVEAQKAVQEAQGDAEKLKAAQEKYQKAVQEYITVMNEARSAELSPREAALRERAAALRKRKINAIAVTERDVFVCTPAVEGYGYEVYRTDHQFANPKKIVEGLRGCCGQMDIQARGEEIFVAENARDRVVRYDRDGKQLSAWGKSDRTRIEGFGSCCNPMNVRLGAAGVVYTSEASLGRIKRYTPDGEFLGLVAVSEIVPGCKHVAIGLNEDGSRVYMLDITRSQIVMLKKQAAE